MITIRNLTRQAIPLNVITRDRRSGEIEEQILVIPGRAIIQVDEDSVRPEQLNELEMRKLIKRL